MLDGLAVAGDSGSGVIPPGPDPGMDRRPPARLQGGAILFQTSTNTAIKALLIDAGLGNPSVPVHYSRSNFLLSGWQLIPAH